MEKILDIDLLLYKMDEKKHKKITFNIEKVMSKLRLEFEYSPRCVGEKNHIIEAFKDGKCEMTSKEALFFKDRYLSGEEELKNLVTLSLYYEDEYIGCAHRSSTYQEIIIHHKESNPGFNNARIKPGQWEIVLSVHGLNTDKMNVSLRAYLE